MFSVVIDEKGYWTGMACKVGRFENGRNVQSLPNETDPTKQQAYKLLNNFWIFDEKRYQELLKEKEVLKNNIQTTENYYINKKRLSDLSEDIVQSMAGIYIPNLNEKLAEFKSTLNQVREYEGKAPKLSSTNNTNENDTFVEKINNLND